MSTPTERRELMLDLADQTGDHNRAERREHYDAADDYDPRDEAWYPDAAELAREDAEIAAQNRRRWSA